VADSDDELSVRRLFSVTMTLECMLRNTAPELLAAAMKQARLLFDVKNLSLTGRNRGIVYSGSIFSNVAHLTRMGLGGCVTSSKVWALQVQSSHSAYFLRLRSNFTLPDQESAKHPSSIPRSKGFRATITQTADLAYALLRFRPPTASQFLSP
jgi:hypothetical protein